MTRDEVLKLFPFVGQGSAAFQKELLDHARLAQVKADTFLYHEGGNCPDFVMVGSGVLRVARISETGRQVTLYRVHRGETCQVNLLCAVLDRPAPATGMVEADAELLVLSSALLRKWIVAEAAVRDYVFRAMAERLTEVIDLIDAIAFGKMDTRLSAYLLEGFVRQDGVRLKELHTTHEKIASELGSAREVVSRLLEQLQSDGAIRLGRGLITLADENVLRRVSRHDG